MAKKSKPKAFDAEERKRALESLRSAVAFLDACKANQREAYETGAMSDALEWIEESARHVLNTFERSAGYENY